MTDEEPITWERIQEEVPFTWKRWVFLGHVGSGRIWRDNEAGKIRLVETRRGSRQVDISMEFAIEYGLIELGEWLHPQLGWQRYDLTDLGRRLKKKWAWEEGK